MIAKRNQIPSDRQQERANYSADEVCGFHAGIDRLIDALLGL